MPNLKVPKCKYTSGGRLVTNLSYKYYDSGSDLHQLLYRNLHALVYFNHIISTRVPFQLEFVLVQVVSKNLKYSSVKETWLRLTSSSSAIVVSDANCKIAVGAYTACLRYTCPSVITELARAVGLGILDFVDFINRRNGNDEGEERGYDDEGSEFHDSGFLLLLW